MRARTNQSLHSTRINNYYYDLHPLDNTFLDSNPALPESPIKHFFDSSDDQTLQVLNMTRAAQQTAPLLCPVIIITYIIRASFPNPNYDLHQLEIPPLTPTLLFQTPRQNTSLIHLMIMTLQILIMTQAAQHRALYYHLPWLFPTPHPTHTPPHTRQLITKSLICRGNTLD